MLSLMNLLLSINVLTAATAQSECHRQTLLTEQVPSRDGKVKVAFFDADSTLRVSKVEGKFTATGRDDVFILPHVADGIAKLNREGYMVVIVSNQKGIASGMISLPDAEAALCLTAKLIHDYNPEATFHYIDFAEGGDEDPRRKPALGMATDLEVFLKTKGLSLDKAKSFMVGDSAYKRNKDQALADKNQFNKPGTHSSSGDREFAINLQVSFFEPSDFFGWRQLGNIDVFERRSEVAAYCRDLAKRQDLAKEIREDAACAALL